MKTKAILIADSGSTKTHWCMIQQDGSTRSIIGKGINPFFQSAEAIKEELIHTLVPFVVADTLGQIYFYGAGCTPEKAPIVKHVLSLLFPDTPSITVESDLLAAAHALCGHEAGIACILGTGSNSCFYDGKEIQQHVSPLGFILGDEGSGAVLGKELVADLLKNQLPTELQTAFFEEYHLTAANIIDRVYRQPFPNRFLASLSPFLVKQAAHPAVHSLILRCFQAFFRRNILQYAFQNYPVHFCGSVAYYHQATLIEAAQSMGIQVGKIIQSPMEDLILYHTNNH